VSAPLLLDEVTRVLTEHVPSATVQPTPLLVVCACGAMADDLATHQGDVLAAAGLLAEDTRLRQGLVTFRDQVVVSRDRTRSRGGDYAHYTLGIFAGLVRRLDEILTDIPPARRAAVGTSARPSLTRGMTKDVRHPQEPDRIVHALTSGGAEVVRYAIASKYWLEYPASRLIPARQITVSEAVWHASAGTVYLGRPGGSRFDRDYCRNNPLPLG